MKDLKRFISYYKPERRLFFADLLAASIIAVLDLLFPIITRTFMKDFIPNRNLRRSSGQVRWSFCVCA